MIDLKEVFKGLDPNQLYKDCEYLSNLERKAMSKELKPNEYQCSGCGNVYEFVWSEEEANAEMESNFGTSSKSGMAVVCDDCYKKIMGAGALSEEELTTKTLDPYEVAVIEAHKILSPLDSLTTVFEVIHRLAELEKQRQSGLMLDETFKKKQ